VTRTPRRFSAGTFYIHKTRKPEWRTRETYKGRKGQRGNQYVVCQPLCGEAAQSVPKRGRKRRTSARRRRRRSAPKSAPPAKICAVFCGGRRKSVPLSPGVEVSRPGVEGVVLLSRDRGVEACRGLSRPVEACVEAHRGLSRLGPCLSVSRCRGVVSRVSSGSSGSSGCRVLSRCLASKVSRYPRWQDAVAAHNKTWAAAAKLFRPLVAASQSCTPVDVP